MMVVAEVLMRAVVVLMGVRVVMALVTPPSSSSPPSSSPCACTDLRSPSMSNVTYTTKDRGERRGEGR